MFNIVYGEDSSYYEMTDEEKELAEGQLEKLPVAYQMMLAIVERGVGETYASYNLKYKSDEYLMIKETARLLQKFGMMLTEDEEKLIDGTHDAYHND